MPLSRLSKLLLVSALLAVALLVGGLPLITVHRISYAGGASPILAAYAQGSERPDRIDLQLNLKDTQLDFQGVKLNLTSADLTVKGVPQENGTVKLTLTLDFQNLAVVSQDLNARIASGRMAGSIIIKEDNQLLVDLETKTSAINIIRSIIGV